MTRRLLALAIASSLLLAACGGEDPTFSTGGGSSGPGASTKLARITTAEEYQMRPKRLGSKVGFLMTVNMTGVKGKRFVGLEFDMPCVSLKATPGGAGLTEAQFEQGFGRTLRDEDHVVVEVVGTARATDGLRAVDCTGSGTTYSLRTATVVLRDGDDLERHEMELERPVVLFTPPRKA